MKKMIRLLVLVFIGILVYSSAWAAATYHQLGVDSSSADKSNFNNSQGVATQIYTTNSQNFTGGGAHYLWIASGIKRPGFSDIFTQIGYFLGCNGCTMYPFIFTSGSGIQGSNIFKIYNSYPLNNNVYHTFWFQTNGTKNPDNTYTWNFLIYGPEYNGINIQDIKFESPNCGAPYTTSEIAGSSSPCSDTLNVTYGNGTSNNYALFALKNGGWQYISHATSGYAYGNCTSNVSSPGFQRDTTVVPQTRSTCSSYSCSSCGTDCLVCGGCQVW